MQPVRDRTQSAGKAVLTALPAAAPLFYKVREAADILRCDERTVRRMCARHPGMARKRGSGSWLIFASWLHDFCAAPAAVAS